VWDQVSLDRGRSWQFPQGLPGEGITPAIIVDPAGQLHLVDAGMSSLDHWFWDGSRWQSEAPLQWPLVSQQSGPAALMASAINKQGKMVVVLAVPTGASGATETLLLYSTHTLELPPKQTTTQEVSTQTPLAPTLTPAIPTPEASSTPANTIDSEPTNSQGATDPNEANGRLSPFTMALLPVALLLLIVLGIVVRQVARVNDR
jgi:hypothetical protein